MGKIANNIETHGDEEKTAFSFPVTGLMLTREQLNELLDDPHADRALFNTKRSGEIEPNLRALLPHHIEQNFEGATVRLKVGELKFVLKGCKVKEVELKPQNGGNTEVSFKLYLRPEDDKQILALLGHQRREIRIGVADAKVIEKGDGAQKDLDLRDEGSAASGDAGEEFEKSAKEQVAAFNRGKRNGAEAH
jgi:hypothetical protein